MFTAVFYDRYMILLLNDFRRLRENPFLQFSFARSHEYVRLFIPIACEILRRATLSIATGKVSLLCSRSIVVYSQFRVVCTFLYEKKLCKTVARRSRESLSVLRLCRNFESIKKCTSVILLLRRSLTEIRREIVRGATRNSGVS